jgi:hypothetical protein
MGSNDANKNQLDLSDGIKKKYSGIKEKRNTDSSIKWSFSFC